MKSLSIRQLHDFLLSLKPDYDVLGPITLHDGTLSLGKLDESEPFSLLAGKIPLRIASLFFPHSTHLLTISHEDRIDVPAPITKPILVVGLSADDLDALEFTDKVYLRGFHDDDYHARRASSIVLGLSGWCGKDGTFSRISEGKCDMELIYDRQRFILAPYTEKGHALMNRLSQGEEIDSIQSLLDEASANHTKEKETLRKASDLLQQNKVSDEFWIEIANRCIECTTCTNVCPTCTCFEMFDIRHPERVERHRMWDSCQFSGFMRETSGHNPLGSQSSRTRRRIHHKLVADVQRWNQISCVLCGRCDESCPTGIGMKAVAKEIVERFA